MTTTIEKNARIAVYLRKSRKSHDEADTLQKHRQTLAEYVDREGFDNVDWFEEVASGESIDGRPVFQSLLRRIDDDEFDAVLVVHEDRLSRGDQYEQGFIQKIFKRSGTVLMTPSKVIDYNDVDQSFQSSLINLFSNYEVEQIKRRMQAGKERAVKDGRMATGRVPFPYENDKNTKTAIVNDDKLKIYRMIIDLYVNHNKSLSQIIDKLYDMKIPSPGGSSRWSTGKLNDIIKSRFHLGKVYSGRYKSYQVEDVDDDGFTTKRRNVRLNDDKTEYVEYEGKHEAVKTEQEHAVIVDLANKRGKAFRQRKKSNEKKRLQGLVRCPHCNRALNIAYTKSGGMFIQKCKGRSKDATPECNKTSGIVEDVIYSAVIATLRQRKDEIFSASESESNDKRLNTLYESLKHYETAIDKSHEKIERAKYMAVEGLIEMDEFKDIKHEAEYDIRNNTQEMRMLEKEVMVLDDVKEARQKERFQSDDVVKLLEGQDGGMSSNDINEILRSIIRQVHYYKDKKNVRLEIEYL